MKNKIIIAFVALAGIVCGLFAAVSLGFIVPHQINRLIRDSVYCPGFTHQAVPDRLFAID